MFGLRKKLREAKRQKAARLERERLAEAGKRLSNLAHLPVKARKEAMNRKLAESIGWTWPPEYSSAREPARPTSAARVMRAATTAERP